jgi:hypothetical protein
MAYELTGLGAGRPRGRISSSDRGISSRPFLGLTQLPVGIGGSFAGIKRLGRKANLSPPTCAEVKKT